MESAGLPEHQIQFIEESFAAIAPRGAAMVARFYQRLFNDHPELVPMFRQTDRTLQQKKLLNSLVFIVDNLRRPELLVPELQQLGVLHNDLDTQPEHYTAVGATLLKTLREYAGDTWDAELEEAWTAAYGLISSTMIDSAQLAAAKA